MRVCPAQSALHLPDIFTFRCFSGSYMNKVACDIITIKGTSNVYDCLIITRPNLTLVLCHVLSCQPATWSNKALLLLQLHPSSVSMSNSFSYPHPNTEKLLQEFLAGQTSLKKAHATLTRRVAMLELGSAPQEDEFKLIALVIAEALRNPSQFLWA